MGEQMNWSEIEAILTEIEQLDCETKGEYRQLSDREALDAVERIERAMKRKSRVSKLR